MTAIISACGLYRYRLQRDLGLTFPGALVFAYFGVNPSFADEQIDDPTVKKLRGFTTRNNGYRFIVGNVFAYRATDVRELANDPLDEDETNWSHILQIIGEADVLVPCWGNHSKVPSQKAGYFGRVLQAMLDSGKPILHFGTTQSGAPKHPVRLGYNTPLLPWVQSPLYPTAATAQ